MSGNILSFFTPLEKYLMNNRIESKSAIGSLAIGFRYTIVCYTLFALVFIAGFINVIAEGMHNTKQMNENPGMNTGITSAQIALSVSIIIFSMAVAGMHLNHNRIAYLDSLKDYKLTELTALADDKKTGFSITYSIFSLFLVFVIFFYGMILLIFSADRLICTTSTSKTCAGITKLTAEEKAALRT